MALPTLRVQADKRQQVNRCFKQIQPVARTNPMETEFRLAPGNIAFVGSFLCCAAFGGVTGIAVHVIADEHCVVMLSGFIDHLPMDESIDRFPADAPLFYQIGKHAVHVFICRRKFKCFFLAPAAFRQRLSVVLQKILDGVHITHSHELPHKRNGIPANLLILVVPEVAPNRYLLPAVQPLPFRSGGLQRLTLGAQKIHKTCPLSDFLLLLCKVIKL